MASTRIQLMTNGTRTLARVGDRYDRAALFLNQIRTMPAPGALT